LLAWGCWASQPDERRRIVALLLIPVAAYGLMALARSGSVLVLQPDAARYHYLSPAILVVVLCLVLAKLPGRLSAWPRVQGAGVYCIWLVLVILPFALGPVPAIKERTVIRQKEQLLQSTRALEAALARHTGEGDIYIPNRPFSVFIWGYTPDHFPGLAALFVVIYPSNIVDGKRVYFVDESAEVVQKAQAQTGARISKLLVHPPAAAAKKS
jgi:hypothetical protein